jgi:phage tail sheath protein FI
MPEYLAPGVYVEEVSFRSKSIEGVPTSTTGFAGLTAYGPVSFRQNTAGPLTTEPRLITSFTDFERVYGGLGRLNPKGAEDRIPFLAHAARAFFANGGQRLYISRVFVPRETAPGPPKVYDLGIASRSVAVGGGVANWRARWPGAAGNVHVEVLAVRSGNIAYNHDKFGVQASRARAGAVVEIVPLAANLPSRKDPLAAANLRVVVVDLDGRQTFQQGGAAVAPAADDRILLVEMQVRVSFDPERVDVYDELAADPAQKRFIAKILQKDDPEDENAAVWLDWKPADAPHNDDYPVLLTIALTQNPNPRLDGGNDGAMVGPDDLKGEEANPDDVKVKATGLEALDDIDDIAIIALPDGGAMSTPVECELAADNLIQMATNNRYRIAVVDAPEKSTLTQIRQFRGKFDSKYAALYHPWIEILDPTERASQGAPPRRLVLPPSGFVTGIYARSDVERGVHKAPANEVVMGLTRFEANINKRRQDVLNPEGINALRFFEGRGNRVWGARTMSSDPEWKYVNVRRLFIYIEHSIDKGTQWAVFEPNGPRLWANIRSTVEDFLLVLWRDGALLGDKPEDAYFVRCDRTTMTQNDLDNGRMICLVGIAPVKPAEYVIFRVGQWTAGAKV